MKTNIKNIASFIATAIWADGHYDEAEKITVNEIADALDLDEKEFNAVVDTEIKNIENLDEDKLNAYLEAAAEGVDDEEVGEIFECALQIVLSDGVMGYSEAENLLAMADALGLEHAMAMMLIADMVKTESDLEISFE